jgi:cyclopropane fatty-acyl-phospholipid synthase-like methyltransferase
MSLDLYAKVEDLLGIEEATASLHSFYLHMLSEHGVTSFLDIGCGRGGLMEAAQREGMSCSGIDLSPVMVEAARAKGLDAEFRDLCEVEGSYDAAVAVFDVLNFLDSKALERFLECAAAVLKPGGLLLADINTLHGFSNVAEGTMSAEDDTRFLSVDARFERNELHTRITLFEKASEACYRKEQETVIQYFHPIKVFRKTPFFKLAEQHGLSLYDRDDKTLLVLKKR